MEHENTGSMTLMIAKGNVRKHEQLDALLNHFSYNAFVYDTWANPKKIAEDQKKWLYNYDHRSNTYLPKLPESILMVLQVYGKRPRQASATNPTLILE
jgi:hypothetical protein